MTQPTPPATPAARPTTGEAIREARAAYERTKDEPHVLYENGTMKPVMAMSWRFFIEKAVAAIESMPEHPTPPAPVADQPCPKCGSPLLLGRWAPVCTGCGYGYDVPPPVAPHAAAGAQPECRVHGTACGPNGRCFWCDNPKLVSQD